jgi:hypothetical protein
LTPQVDGEGRVSALDKPWNCFPDTKAKVLGTKSGYLPAKLTTWKSWRVLPPSRDLFRKSETQPTIAGIVFWHPWNRNPLSLLKSHICQCYVMFYKLSLKLFYGTAARGGSGLIFCVIWSGSGFILWVQAFAGLKNSLNKLCLSQTRAET